jgi:hypothetical protein
MVRPTSGDTIKVGGVNLYHEAAHDAGHRKYHPASILIAQHNPNSARKSAPIDNYLGAHNQVGMWFAVLQLETLAQGFDLDVRQGNRNAILAHQRQSPRNLDRAGAFAAADMYEEVVRKQGHLNGYLAIVAPLPLDPGHRKKMLYVSLGIILGYPLLMMRSSEDCKPPALLLRAAKVSIADLNGYDID